MRAWRYVVKCIDASTGFLALLWENNLPSLYRILKCLSRGCPLTFFLHRFLPLLLSHCRTLLLLAFSKLFSPISVSFLTKNR